MSRTFLTMSSLFLALSVLVGCSPSQVEFDKAALSQVKKVAVVIYTVPLAIQVRDDPREANQGAASATDLLKAVAVSAANTGDGTRAATLAQATFIETLNQQGLSFQAISRDEMMGNPRFSSMAREELNQIMAEQAKAKEEREKKQGAMGKAVGFLSSFGGGSPGTEDAIGSSPEGMPAFGLVGNWSGAKGALLGIDREKAYVMKAIEALGVDAAIVINDPGYSWGCETCINSTGNASTQSAFLISMVDRSGKTILDMRQWFSIGGGNAAMVTGVINPLQHDGLFKGHGEKTARVFADYYKEENAK